MLAQSAPQAAAPHEAEAAALFREARAALADLPAQVAPVFLDKVAQAELASEPKQAVKDFQAAFQQAQSLEATQSNVTWGYATAQSAEAGAIRDLAQAKKFRLALDLLHRLGSSPGFPKALLYDALIRSKPDLPPAQAVSLILECQRDDGSFPFHAAIAVLQNPKLRPPERLQFAITADRAAASAAGGVQSANAIQYLMSAHAAEPAADTDLEEAVTALIRRYGTEKPALIFDPEGLVASTPAFRERQARASGHDLLAILRSLDPERAKELQAQFPQFAVIARRPGFVIRIDASGKRHILPGRPPLDRIVHSAAKEPAAALDAAGALKTKIQQFAAYARIAWTLRHAQPDAALQAAARAQDLLSPEVIQADTEIAAELAVVLHAFGQPGDERLAMSCLDQVEKRAENEEADYSQLSADKQARAADNLGRTAFMLVPIFGLAAQVDWHTTVQRAELMRSVVLKPLVLAAIAASAAKPLTAASE